MPELDVDGDEDVDVGGDGVKKAEGEGGLGEGMDVEAQGEGGVHPESSTDPGITSIAVSPDGRYVAAGSLDSAIRLWDLRPRSASKPPSSASSVPATSSSPAPPKLIERLKGHKDSVYSVSFTRDGRFLVSASLDKGVRVWDVGHLGIVPAPGVGTSVVPTLSTTRNLKTRCVTQFVGHRDFVLSVAVSHDGKWVVSGSKDRGVMWWELGTAAAAEEKEDEKEALGGKDREAVCVLQGHKNIVISIDLSPVGNMLATGSGDWQARICEFFGFNLRS